MKAKKGRTLLLCGVFSAILIFVLAGLTIRSAALTATENAQKSVGATVTLATDRETAMKKNMTGTNGERPDPSSFRLTPVNLAEAEKIAALGNVKTYSYSSATSAGATTGVTPISNAESTTTENTNESAASPNKSGGLELAGGAGGNPAMAQSDFKVNGVMDLTMYTDFSEGTAKIIEGEGITKADEGTNNVVIEKTLAEANELSVGDTFKITNPEDESTTYELTVKGIYESTANGDSLGMMFNFLNPANTLYTSYTFANTLKGAEAEGTIDSAVYTLNDPKEMAAFVKAAEKLIDTETFSLQTNDQAYQQMLKPLNNVASFAQNIVILVSLAGVIILTLIIMMTIRERRYEVGVLLSLGESRFKVILQFFSEIIICMLIAFTIASFSGNIIGNVVGEQLIQQQTEQNSEAEHSIQEGKVNPGSGLPSLPGGINSLGASSSKVAAEIEKLTIAIKPIELVKLAGMGVMISFISILLSSIGILRLQPKKILTT